MQEDGRKKTTALTFVYNKCDRATTAVLANLFSVAMFSFTLHHFVLVFTKRSVVKGRQSLAQVFSNIILSSNLSHRLAVFFPLLSYQVNFANMQKDALDLVLVWMIQQTVIQITTTHIAKVKFRSFACHSLF